MVKQSPYPVHFISKNGKEKKFENVYFPLSVDFVLKSFEQKLKQLKDEI